MSKMEQIGWEVAGIISEKIRELAAENEIDIKVNDSIYILPKIDKNFEMFTDESEEEDNE